MGETIVMANQNHTFISYKSEEQDKARLVYESLEANNIDVWWDENLQAGQKWEEDIDVALGNADAVVVLWSNHARESEWVKNEASIAKHNFTLVNVKLEECDIPHPFQSIQFENLSLWRGDSSDKLFLELVKAIKSKRRLVSTIRAKAKLYRNIVVAILVGIAVCLVIIIMNWLNADLVFSGTILDAKNEPVNEAVVAIPDIGKSFTNSKGRFQLSVPASRTMQSYSIDIAKNGFFPQSISVDSSNVKGIQVNLKRLSSDDLVRVEPKVAIGHYLGTPQLDLRVEFINPTDEMLRFEIKSLRLTCKDEVPIYVPLFQQYFDPGTPRVNAVPLVLLHSDDPKYNPTFIFSLIDRETVLLGSEVEKILGSTKFLDNVPHLNTPILPQSVTNRIKSHFKRRWIWNPVEYTLQFNFTIGRNQYSVARSFVLSDDQIKSMKKIVSLYECGFGCIYGRHEFTVEDAKPFFVVDLKSD